MANMLRSVPASAPREMFCCRVVAASFAMPSRLVALALPCLALPCLRHSTRRGTGCGCAVARCCMSAGGASRIAAKVGPSRIESQEPARPLREEN